MLFSYFITKRFVLSKKDTGFFSFISVITIVGIALGVSALIIALSILEGFERTITTKVTDFDAHIKILSYRNTLPDYHEMLPKIKGYLGNNVQDINIFASSLAVVTSKRGTEGVNIIGILPDKGRKGMRNDITSGRYDLEGNSSVIIGRKLADKLFVKTGDKITLFTLQNEQLPSPENLPGIKTFIIKGIFESGMAEYDDQFVYINLRDAQDLFKISDNISGYDIWLKDINKTDSLKSILAEKLKYPHRVSSIFEIHKNIFTWISLQKKPIPIVFGLIIIVAVLNIIGTLLMMILEKTKAIGILKSLGASGRQITGIFLLQGVILAMIGIVLGNLIAYILMIIQLTYNVISLPSSVYFMSTVPIYLSLKIFAGVSVLAFILCVLASYIPSFIASRLKPVSTLRFD